MAVKKIENISENPLDIKLESKNSEVPTESPESNNSHLQEFEEIISPDGKYKFRRAKNIEFAEYRANAITKIPKLEKEGYVIHWPTDLKENYLSEKLKQGWDYVRNEMEGFENATLKIYAGKDKDGRAYFHYAMMIAVDLYNKLQISKSEYNKKLVEDSLKRPIGDPIKGASEYTSVANAMKRGKLI